MQTTTLLGLNKPDYTDFADVADLNENADLIDAALAAKRSITLTAAGWTGSAPYTQTVAVADLVGNETPIALLDTSGSTSLSNEKTLKKNFGYISYYDTAAGQITFTALHAKPTVNLTVVLKGV